MNEQVYMVGLVLLPWIFSILLAQIMTSFIKFIGIIDSKGQKALG